jgi:signal transduction histidine kinase
MMFASLRIQLLLIIFLASLPGGGFIVLASLEQRQSAEMSAKQDLLEKVHAVAAQQGQVITEAGQTLALLAQIPAIRQATPEGAAIVANLLRNQPAYANLGVTDHQGKILCSAAPLSQPASIADRYYFIQALQSRRLSVGIYQLDRFTQKPILGLAYPILDADGQVIGMVFAALDLGWLQSLTSTFLLLPEASLTVIDSNGTVLARVPEPEKFVGQLHPDVDIIQTVLARKEGTTEARGLDGKDKLFAFAPLIRSHRAGYVYAGLPARVLLAPIHRHLINHLLWLGLILAGSLVVAWLLSSWLILERLQRLTRVTERMAAGDLEARTGLSYGKGELELLARRFDHMGEELQHRERYLQAVNYILAGATQADRVQDLLEVAVAEIARFTGCRAVGIRILQPDGSIPYEAFQGFSPEFFQVESNLCLQKQGICVNVIQGYTNSELSFCTGGGSFYVNAASHFLASASPEVRETFHCVCHQAGYESIALIPLRQGLRILGLIHVADLRENRVPRSLVEDLETMAMRLTVALEGLMVKESLRALSHELIRLQEKERLNLSRELHDSLAQDLAALKIEVDTLIHDLADPPEKAPTPGLAKLSGRLQEVIGLVRDLAHDLRPPLLDKLGLVQAIQVFCQEFTKRTGIPVDFLAAGVEGVGLDADTAITLFRLVQEGLTNIRKHARASQVTIRLVASHPNLILRLEDDGSGFEVGERRVAPASDRRLGLIGMVERVTLLGGRMEITSDPGQGTKIAVEIPLRNAPLVET